MSGRRTGGVLALAVGLAAAAVVGPALAPSGPGAGVLPSASALPAFTDCEELRTWYVDAALPKVGPWGFESVVATATLDRAAEGSGVAGSAPGTDTGAVSGSDTGTNVQEAGVDEPDVAKTDGRLLVRVDGDALEVHDVSGPDARLLARHPLPGPAGTGRELLLVGDTVLVVGTDGGWWGGREVVADLAHPWPGTATPRTHLVTVDLSTPAAPVVTGHQRVDGTLVGAREYGDGTVRAVVATGLPQLDFVTPDKDRTPREALRENRAVVRATAVEDWLPGLDRGDGSGRQPLLDCTSVRHPERDAGVGTLSVLTFPIASPGSLAATAVTAAGELVYSSADRLYVATLDAGWWDVLPLAGGVAERDAPRPLPPSTDVHAFDVSGTGTAYVASGTVPGTVRDRWSMSEHDGRLRVASALGHGWDPRENAVHVLEEDGTRLRVVGSVDGLGPRERIQSVRWLGDLAVVVTFRQTDPLYTLDLSEPTDPRVLGELKIRGFSAYLHPVGDGLLLGLGRDATLDGLDLGPQAAVFDLADLTDVRRTTVLGFERSAELAPRWEPRAFTYLPERRLALVPVESWDPASVRLVALRVGEDGSLVNAASWPLGQWGAATARALPLDGDRVALVHHGVRVVRLP